MGEHQCPHCGHITTGFERQEFDAHRNSIIDECIKALPGGTHCDPQQIADILRQIKS